MKIKSKKLKTEKNQTEFNLHTQYEWLNRFKFHTYSQLYESIRNYITWYNTKRLHSSLGYLSPLEMEMKLKGIIKKVA